MLGAIIGDIVGSRFEHHNHKSKYFEFLDMNCRFTVDDIDNIVRLVRFPGWQKMHKGVQDIQSEVLKIIWIQYKIKDKEIIDKAYSYIEQYY